MGSGSRRIHTRPGSGEARAPSGGGLPALGSILALALLLGSCSGPQGDFSAALAAIDALVPAPASAAGLASREARLDRAFKAAYRSAANSSNWLSLLRRAAERGSASALECAAEALKAAPRSEAVAAAVAQIYLRAGLPERALSLFDKGAEGPGVNAALPEPAPLSPEGRPGLWAEAFLAARGKGSLPPALDSPAASARLAAILGQPDFLIDAALLAFGRGDRFAAASYLRAALAQGSESPSIMLWDAGLAAELSALAPAARSLAGKPGPRTSLALAGLGDLSSALLLEGDAAALAGDPALARLRWGLALELEPKASWKARSKLALSAPDRDAGLAAARRLVRDFPAEDGARRFAAAYFLESGREGEARALLGLQDSPLAPPGPAPSGGTMPEGAEAANSAELELLRLALAEGQGPEDRLLVESLRLLETRPDSPVLRESTLRLLLERGRFPDFLAIFDSGEARGFGFGNRWFYAAAALALRGDFPESAELLEREAPAHPGASGAFALGLVYAEIGDFPKALERLEVALDSAGSARERAEILKEIGRNQGRLGESSLARASYRAAALADPGDPEAAFLADTK